MSKSTRNDTNIQKHKYAELLRDRRTFTGSFPPNGRASRNSEGLEGESNLEEINFDLTSIVVKLK